MNSIDFSEDGSLLVCADDNTLIIYDAINAKKVKTLFNKVNGIKNVRFTHSNEAVICSTKHPPCKYSPWINGFCWLESGSSSIKPKKSILSFLDEIFYWSVHENEIIKIFEGHQEPVTTLFMNPSDDSFVSIGGESELKVFNLESSHSKPISKLNLAEEACKMAANFDSTGVVLAVSVYCTKTNKNRIDLFDVKKYSEGRFDLWRIDGIKQIKMIKFSSNGTYILAATHGANIIILDAFEGKKLQILTGFTNDLGTKLEASFSADSRYVIGGSDDGSILVWDVDSGSQIAKLEGHVKPCRNVKFSSNFVMMASACQNVILWIPKFWS